MIHQWRTRVWEAFRESRPVVEALLKEFEIG